MNFKKVETLSIKHFQFYSVLGEEIKILIQGLEGKSEFLYRFLMSLLVTS